jgi:glycosyltransferase involved in cell wall biosynthesis
MTSLFVSGADASEPVGAARRTWSARPAGAPLRLLHVFTRFNTGGAQVRFATLAGELGSRFSHTVLALTGDYEAASLVPPGVDIRYLPPPPPARSVVSQLAHYRALANHLRPDVLLTYNWGAIEFAVANVLGAPHLHLEDGFGPDEAVRQFRRRIWLRRIALRRSHVVVPSATLADIARRTWQVSPRRLHHIANGVPTKTAARTPLDSLGLDLPPGLIRVVWTGALRAEKNPLRLLQAFAPVRDRAVLLVIGDGPERESLLRAADGLGLGERMRLLGRRDDARDLIMQCDVLALSSDTEQMPLVVLEAMDAGLPVASVDVGDVRRMLAPENHPFVTPCCGAALGGALQALIADPELRRRVGQANRRHVAEYSLDRMVERHRSVLEALATRRAVPVVGAG